MSEVIRKKNPNNSFGPFLLGLCLAAGMVLSAAIVSKTFERVRATGQMIKVKGYTEREIVSDLAVWRANYSAQSPELVSAYAKLEADTEKVRAFLESQGVDPEKVDFSPVTNTVRYKRDSKGYDTTEIEAYVLTQSIGTRSTDIDLISRISKKSSSLIEQGIGFSSFPPSYHYTKLNDLKIELLGEATLDAKARAVALAENSGARVGALRSASQGVFQVTERYSTEVSNYGISDTGSIEKAIKAVVTIEYAIQ